MGAIDPSSRTDGVAKKTVLPSPAREITRTRVGTKGNGLAESMLRDWACATFARLVCCGHGSQGQNNTTGGFRLRYMVGILKANARWLQDSKPGFIRQGLAARNRRTARCPFLAGLHIHH